MANTMIIRIREKEYIMQMMITMSAEMTRIVQMTCRCCLLNFDMTRSRCPYNIDRGR